MNIRFHQGVQDSRVYGAISDVVDRIELLAGSLSNSLVESRVLSRSSLLRFSAGSDTSCRKLGQSDGHAIRNSCFGTASFEAMSWFGSHSLALTLCNVLWICTRPWERARFCKGFFFKGMRLFIMVTMWQGRWHSGNKTHLRMLASSSTLRPRMALISWMPQKCAYSVCMKLTTIDHNCRPNLNCCVTFSDNVGWILVRIWMPFYVCEERLTRSIISSKKNCENHQNGKCLRHWRSDWAVWVPWWM